MKTLIALCILLFGTALRAEICTVVIRNQYGDELDTFTRVSYSLDAACDDARWDCNRELSEEQSEGRYYDAYCSIKDITPSYPPRYPAPSYPPTYPPRYPSPSYPPSYPSPYPSPYPPSYPPRYPDPYPPRYPAPTPAPYPPRYPAPGYPREPGREPGPSYPREPGREPRLPFPGPREPGREPPRDAPGSGPRYPGPRFTSETDLDN